MRKPLISVITVVYNAALTLEETIKSVISQDKDLVEYWIIDAGSTDGSVDIIRKYETELAGWVCEPDEGIYDAMNKGIDRSNGDWLYFLGGDDKMRTGVVKYIQPYLTQVYSIVFGDILFDNGYQMRSYLGIRTVLQNTVHHQSAFYNSSLFVNYRYDKRLTIVSEYEIHLKVYLNRLRTSYVPVIIADCATGGASSQLSKSLQQTNEVRIRHIHGKWKNKLLSFALKLYYSQKRIRFLLYGHRI